MHRHTHTDGPTREHHLKEYLLRSA